jgi:hypothetical protein
MIGMIMLLIMDTTSVNIRALVSRDMDRAAMRAAAAANQGLAGRVSGISDFVLILELAMIIALTALLVALIVRARRIMKEQREKIVSAQRMSVKRPPVISRAEIERILNEIAVEKANTADMAKGSYYIDHNGKLDSGAAVHEMARAHGMESERLNFAISYASQAARQSGAKFKEAFALVSEESDLNVLARQLNMGKGELELILALKRSKIANSRTVRGTGGGRQ